LVGYVQNGHGPAILTHPGRTEGKRAAADLKAFGSPL
jgi:hypothetical protein